MRGACVTFSRPVPVALGSRGCQRFLFGKKIKRGLSMKTNRSLNIVVVAASGTKKTSRGKLDVRCIRLCFRF